MSEGLVGGFPVGHLKEALKSADDDALVRFLRGYTMGAAADTFIANMNSMPDERIGFFIGLAATYPEDWDKAVAAVNEAAKAVKGASNILDKATASSEAPATQK